MPVLTASETIAGARIEATADSISKTATDFNAAVAAPEALAVRMAAVIHIGSRGHPLANACRHPDKNLGSEEESKEKFNQVHAAYTKLLAEDSDEEDADMYGNAPSDEDDVAFSFFFFMCDLSSSFDAALSHSSFLWLMQIMAAVIAPLEGLPPPRVQSEAHSDLEAVQTAAVLQPRKEHLRIVCMAFLLRSPGSPPLLMCPRFLHVEVECSNLPGWILPE